MQNNVTSIFQKYLDSISKISDDDIKLYKNAVKFMNLGDYNSALKSVGDLCKRFPFNTIFLKTMAACFQKQEKYQAAIMVYKTAQTMIPDSNIDCFYFCGVCYYKIGEFEAARNSFLDFLSKDGSDDIQKKRAKLYLSKIKNN